MQVHVTHTSTLTEGEGAYKYLQSTQIASLIVRAAAHA